MPVNPRWLACLALLPSLALAAGSCDRLVATANPDAPPYAWRDPANPGVLIGASVDVLKNIATQLGVNIDVRYAGNGPQALEDVRSGRMDIFADAALVESDLEHLDYVYPPLQPAMGDAPAVYLAIGQDSACNDGWLRGQLAKKMTELNASGGIQAILQRNAERWELQQQAAAGAVKP